jgi:thioredoxin-related protein
MRRRRITSKLRLLTVLAALAMSGGGGTASASAVDDSEIKHIVYPDWFSEDPFFDLPEELGRAGAGGKLGVMVLFTTEGCSYCHLFIRKSLGDADLAALVQQHFESVGLEIFDDRDMNDPRGVPMPIKAFADREGAEFAPTLLFYDLDGERILKVVGYQSPERFRLILEFLIDDHFRSQTLPQFFKARAETKQARLATGDAGLIQDPMFMQPPYHLDRSVSRGELPLLVIFEQRDCAECEGFHTTVLADDEVRETLKGFNVVRLDAGDGETALVTPGGQRVTPAAWFEASAFSRTPALVFFDASGSMVLETDALVLRQRMMNSLNYVLERAYEKGWTYQRFARSKAIERWQAQQEKANRN